MILDTIEISAVKYDNEPVIRSLSAVALLITTGGTQSEEYIKWSFDDSTVRAYNTITNTPYITETVGLLSQLSSMVFKLSSEDTYDYTIEQFRLLETSIFAAWLSGARFADLDVDLENVEEITSISEYKIAYDTFPNIRPPVLYINYENTDYSPIFYRQGQIGTTYNARISAIHSQSLLNLTNLLISSENFQPNVWTTATNITAISGINLATPTNKLSSATRLVPISSIPLDEISTITNVFSADLPETFLTFANTYNIPTSGYTTSGNGVSATFSIVISNSAVSGISVTNGGRFYRPGDFIEINRTELGLASNDNTISFNVNTVKNSPHEIARNVGPLPPQDYTYSIFAYPSGGKYLYFGGFDQGYAIFDLEQEIPYNLGTWTSVNMDRYELELEGLAPTFNISFDNTVNTAILSGTTLSGSFILFGGDFTKCNNIQANRICAVELSSGNLRTEIFPAQGFNNTVNTIALSSGKVFVGGKFTSYNNLTANTNYIVCLTGSNNIGLASQSTFSGNLNGEVFVIKPDTTRNIIFIGGNFSFYSNFGTNGGSGNSRNGIVATHSNGVEVPISVYDIRGWNGISDTSYNSNAGVGLGGTVKSIEFVSQPAESILLGGSFNSWRGNNNTQNIVGTNKFGTRIKTFGFSPGFGGINVSINSITSNQNIIYIGGSFSTYNNASVAPGLIKLNTNDKTIKQYSGFPLGSVVKTLALSNNKSRLYVGGIFTGYGGSPYTNLIRFNTLPNTNPTTNDTVDPTFKTLEGFDGAVNTIILSGDSANNDNIFTGGSFTRYKDTFINNSTKLNTTGEIDTIVVPVAGARDWKRCTATFTLTSAKTDKLILGITTEETTVSSLATQQNDILVWGAQLNYGNAGPAVPYLSTANTTRSQIFAKSSLFFNNSLNPFVNVNLSSTTVFTTAHPFSIGNLPMLSTIKATISANSTYDSFKPWYTPHTISHDISAVFVSKLLTADFIAYPQYYFLSSGQPIGPFGPPPFGNSGENHTLTQGPCFYGEGHTEIVNLCATGTNASQYFWFIEDDSLTYNVSSSPTAGKYGVSIPTQIGVYPSIPITLVVSDGVILSSGPYYYFDDNTGFRQPYPFYYSTAVLSSYNTLYKKNIDVVSYVPPASTFDTGLVNCPEFLPTDDTLKLYTAYLRFSLSGQAGNLLSPCFGIYDLDWRWTTFKHLSAPITTPPFGATSSYTEISSTLTNKPSSWYTTQCFVTSNIDPPYDVTLNTLTSSLSGPYPKKWLFQPSTNEAGISRTPNQSWGSPLTWLLSTENWSVVTTLSNIQNQQNPDFYYSLQNQSAGNNPYTFSIYKNLRLFLEGSQTIFTTISAAPYDWDTKQYIYRGSGMCDFESRGDFRLYTPNRYVLTGTQINFQNLSLGFNNVNKIVVNLDEGQTKILQSTTLYDNLTATYKIPGYKTITATVEYINSNVYPDVTTTFADIIKVVKEYDNVDTVNYRSQKTPLTLPWPETPAIAANEWVNSDNINSVFQKFYENLEYLNSRSRSYNDGPDEFYGWLGTVPNVINVCPVYTWEDIDCLNGGTEVKWEDVQVVDSNFPTITTTGALASCCTWEQHTCKPNTQNPDRLGKYCIVWKWVTRKSNVSTIPVTWASTKNNRAYSKKWLFEPCTTKDGLVLVGTACNEGEWQVNIDKINTYHDPIVNCSSVSRCVYRDIVSRDNLLYVALTNEIKVLSSDYSATFITSKMLLDDIFAFRDIRGLAFDSTNKLFVLDGTLNKVASYNVKLNDPIPFELVLSWGGYGALKSQSKFSKPNDICVDNLDNVWVADTGNKCIKQYTNTGTWLQTITDNDMRNTPPISIAVDSENNIHILMSSKVKVYKQNGEFNFEYNFTNIINNSTPIKITSNYVKEIMYIVFEDSILRYFRTGTFAGFLIDKKQCANGIQGAFQDEYRNTLVISKDKILKYIDVMDQLSISGRLPNTYWPLSDLYIGKEEYIQNWVYNKSLQRLWDNIEILRHTLMYNSTPCKQYKSPKYDKTKILIGQNEIVTSTVINRNIQYLWENLNTLLDYFDPNCT